MAVDAKETQKAGTFSWCNNHHVCSYWRNTSPSLFSNFFHSFFARKLT